VIEAILDSPAPVRLSNDAVTWVPQIRLEEELTDCQTPKLWGIINHYLWIITEQRSYTYISLYIYICIYIYIYIYTHM
jgi:hypothetical protein